MELPQNFFFETCFLQKWPVLFRRWSQTFSNSIEHIDMICFCSNAECQTCPNSIFIILKLGLLLQIIAKEGKLFQELSRVAPILGLLETLIHENQGAT